MKKFTHKFAYIAGGVIIGIVFSTTAGAFADSVKSMVGKKVTGEYLVVVNGKGLSDKGAVIDSKANVPARSLSEALGADVKVSGKTIYITTDEEQGGTSTAAEVPSSNNEYSGRSKADLEGVKQVLIEKILEPTKAGREVLLKELADAEKNGSEQVIEAKKKQIATYDADIEKYSADLAKVEAALAATK
ncbi:copper amine oxidase [Paenibacillus taichungensis]|uniref:Copper amine oxidase n=1 Tax=Paenibacillus taichungensis TaxID=484184 RepID=A0ABX2MFM5_9BACL|nr:copper amine oxidase [Paenibacillus taichungensis]NUU52706.1 copper amine oxidase [Paenibacillus taichungensis]